MAIYSYWFLLALVLLGLEMATGTFYLLVVSAAMAVAGLAALLDAGAAWQFTLCALAIIAGSAVLRLWKNTRRNEVAGASLDIGQPVQVLTWHENGSARVIYRGAEWDAAPESACMPHDGTLYIKEMHGSSLILTDHKPQQS